MRGRRRRGMHRDAARSARADRRRAGRRSARVAARRCLQRRRRCRRCRRLSCASRPRIRRRAGSKGDVRSRSRSSELTDERPAAPVQDLFGPTWPAVWTLVKIVAIAVPLILAVAYLTLRRAQGDRLDAGAHRPQSRRPARTAAAVRRRAEDAVQGDRRPDGCEPQRCSSSRRCCRSDPRSRRGR